MAVSRKAKSVLEGFGCCAVHKRNYVIALITKMFYIRQLVSDQNLDSPLNLFLKNQFSLPLADKTIISLDYLSSYVSVRNVYYVHYTKVTTLNNITIVTCNKIDYCLFICFSEII